MPELDGIETARRMRRYVGPDVLIIIISAYDWSGIEEQAKAAGVNAFIAKPIFCFKFIQYVVNCFAEAGAGIFCSRQ